MKVIWQARWQKLAPRERQVISWGGAVLLAGVMYAYLWQPIEEERRKLRATIPQLRGNAVIMQHQVRETIQLKTSRPPAPQGEALASAIFQTANETGLDSKSLRISMADAGHADLVLEAISFDSWTTLVANLQKNQRIRLESCMIDALPETDKVRVRAVVNASA